MIPRPAPSGAAFSSGGVRDDSTTWAVGAEVRPADPAVPRRLCGARSVTDGHLRLERTLDGASAGCAAVRPGSEERPAGSEGDRQDAPARRQDDVRGVALPGSPDAMGDLEGHEGAVKNRVWRLPASRALPAQRA